MKSCAAKGLGDKIMNFGTLRTGDIKGDTGEVEPQSCVQFRAAHDKMKPLPDLRLNVLVWAGVELKLHHNRAGIIFKIMFHNRKHLFPVLHREYRKMFS